MQPKKANATKLIENKVEKVETKLVNTTKSVVEKNVSKAVLKNASVSQVVKNQSVVQVKNTTVNGTNASSAA